MKRQMEHQRQLIQNEMERREIDSFDQMFNSMV